MRGLSEQYKSFLREISQIGSIYGGWQALVRSPFLHISAIITLACWSIWTKPGWWDLPLAVLPNLVGFTLGGYAILMALGDEDFKRALAGSVNGEPSPYLTVSATFAHFISTQILSILLGIIGKAQVFSSTTGILRHYIDVTLPSGSLQREFIVVSLWGVSFWIFIYSLVLTLAATLGVFHMTGWYEKAQSIRQSKKASGH